MLCMIVRDIYRQCDAVELRKALERLFDGNAVWDSTGLYAFWDPATRRVLYIGLDGRLSRRFRSHNGRPSGRTTGDKREQVSAWFARHSLLGYSVIAQSSAVRLLEHLPLGETATEIIGLGEGQLIETYKQIHGEPPPWNRMGGSVHGRLGARPRPSMLELLTGPLDSLLVARLTIRELAGNPEGQRHEQTIHTARIHASFEAALSTDPSLSDADVRRWLMRLAGAPERFGVEIADHVALAASGYLMLDAPFSEDPIGQNGSH